jgi:hypothetical protein
VQTQLPAPTTGTRTSQRRRRTTIAGLSLALPLALVAAIGVTQITGPEAARTAEPVVVSEAQQALPAQRAALMAAPQQLVYIAATQEQAAYALRFSAEINALRTELGQPQVPVGALVVGTDGAMALEGLPGAPGTRYLDLRTQ